MATITPARHAAQLGEYQRRVRSPLARLRGYMTAYVVFQGVLLLLVLAAAWFWIYLAFDYGFFKLFSLDLAKDWPAPVRVVLLLLLWAGMLLVLSWAVIGRLLRDLRAALLDRRKEYRPSPMLNRRFLVLTASALGLAAISAIWIYGLKLWPWQVNSWAIRLLLILAAWGAMFLAASWVALGWILYGFGDVALALMLERRFPGLLGDRLITAVELADLRRAQEQGYSPAMVLETIHEASERAQKIPILKAFDWGRLVRRGLLTVGLTLGLYVLTGAAFLGFDSLWPAPTGRAGFGHLDEVAGIWFERDVLLQHSLWPRRAQLEFINVPEAGLRVGRGNPIPPVTLRAAEYVVAEPDAPDGWRPLTWNDLTTRRKELLGENTPVAATPPLKVRDPAVGLTVDEAALQRRKFDVRIAPAGTPAAARWATSDPQAPGGWRSLLWSELAARLDNHEALPSVIVNPAQLWSDPSEQLSFRSVKPPASWTPKDPTVGLTVDEVEAYLAKEKEAGETKEIAAALAQAQQLAAAGALDKGGVRPPLRWMVADATAVRGWRPLLWSDLTSDKLGGLNPPAAFNGKTVDAVETAVAANRDEESAKDAEVVLSVLGHLADMGGVLDQVDARAALPAMSRTLRRLDVPKKVFLEGSGANSTMHKELTLTAENEYTATFDAGEELPESINFHVRADDYWTPYRSITLVPPPTLVGLDVQENRPAYLYYRPDGATTLEYLRGLKQPFAAFDAHQDGPKTERIDVPAGTDLVLTAKVSKDLKEASLLVKNAKDLPELAIDVAPGQGRVVRWQPAKEKDGDQHRVPLEVSRNRREFQIGVADVRRQLVLVFEFTDADGVQGERQVEIVPQEDMAPELKEVHIDPAIRNGSVKRKGEEKKYYMVTEKARIPLYAKIADDYALGDVVYRYTVAGVTPDLTEPPGRENGSYSPPQFRELLRDSRDGLTSDAIHNYLAKPQLLPFRRLKSDAEIKTDTILVGKDKKSKNPKDWHSAWEDLASDTDAPRNPLHWDFPLWRRGLVLDDSKPFYRLDLWLEASDTYAGDPAAAGGPPQPHVSKSKETFAFLVVNETFLLGHIGQDEAKQYGSLHKRFQDLGALSADFDVFTHEGLHLEKLLESSDDPQDKDAAGYVQRLLDDVTEAHASQKLNDVDKFLATSTPYRNLQKRIQEATDQSKRLLQSLYALADEPDEAEFQDLVLDNLGILAAGKPLPPDEAADRRRVERNHELHDSLQTTAAVLAGLQDEKSPLTLALEKLNEPDVKVGELVTQSVRASKISEALDQVLATTRETVDKYDVLIREEQLNVVNPNYIEHSQRIIDEAHQLLAANSGVFAQAQDGLAQFRKALDEKGARSDKERIDEARKAGAELQPKLIRVVAAVFDLFDAMQGGQDRQSVKELLIHIDKGVVQQQKDAELIEKIIENGFFDAPPK